MPAGQPIKGKNMRLSFEGKTLFHATSCGLSISTTLEAIATKDTDGEMNVPGNYSWTLTTSALYANKPMGSTQTDFNDLIVMQLAGTEIDVEFTTGETGDKVYSGKAYIESADITAEVGSMANGSFSFKGNGSLTVDTVA